MPDYQPQYRFRGAVKPSAEVSRPVAAYRNASTTELNGQMAARSATLDIFDVIDGLGGWWGTSAHDVDQALAQLGDIDTLYVRVNSPGGEATEGVAIANLLRAHPAEVRVTVYGIAASAASIIAVAGNSLSMAPGSVLMVHDASGFAYGDASAMQAGLNMLNAVSDSYASLYALKAGGSDAEWRTVMRETTWFTPAQAVEAKLADRVGLDPALPADLPPVEDDTDDGDEGATVIEIDIELNPAARAAARRFDLSLLPAAALAPQAPAKPPVVPSTNTKEADTMSDTLTKGLRERLGVTDETLSEADLLSALDEALAEGVDAGAQANSNNSQDTAELTVLRRELDATQAQLRNLSEARQRDEDTARDEAKQRVFGAAFARGAVHPADHPERVQDEADYDAAPEVMTRVLAGRADGSRIPVKAPGYGSDTDAKAQADTDWFPQFSDKPKVEA